MYLILAGEEWNALRGRVVTLYICLMDTVHAWLAGDQLGYHNVHKYYCLGWDTHVCVRVHMLHPFIHSITHDTYTYIHAIILHYAN